MKKVRAAAVIAGASWAYTQVQEFARANPDRAAQAIDSVESFLRSKAGPQYASKIDGGGTAVRRHLGLAERGSASGGTVARPATDDGPGDRPAAASGFDPAI